MNATATPDAARFRECATTARAPTQQQDGHRPQNRLQCHATLRWYFLTQTAPLTSSRSWCGVSIQGAATQRPVSTSLSSASTGYVSQLRKTATVIDSGDSIVSVSQSGPELRVAGSLQYHCDARHLSLSFCLRYKASDVFSSPDTTKSGYRAKIYISHARSR